MAGRYVHFGLVYELVLSSLKKFQQIFGAKIAPNFFAELNHGVVDVTSNLLGFLAT